MIGNPSDGSNAKGSSIKPKASFQTLGTHSRSQNFSNTMTIHIFSRELIDVKVSIVSFRIFYISPLIFKATKIM